MTADDYMALNEAEKEMIQEIKRSLARIKSKNENISTEE